MRIQREREEIRRENAEKKRVKAENNTTVLRTEQESLDSKIVDPTTLVLDGKVERRDALTMLIKFLVSPAPYKEIFGSFGKDFNQDLFKLIQLILRVADKIKIKTQLASPGDYLDKDEMIAFDVYKNALKCGDRKRIIDSLSGFIQWARPRIGIQQEVL